VWQTVVNSANTVVTTVSNSAQPGSFSQAKVWRGPYPAIPDPPPLQTRETYCFRKKKEEKSDCAPTVYVETWESLAY
jgi:hypothetical protein